MWVKKKMRNYSRSIYTGKLASLMDHLSELENLPIDSVIIED